MDDCAGQTRRQAYLVETRDVHVDEERRHHRPQHRQEKAPPGEDACNVCVVGYIVRRVRGGGTLQLTHGAAACAAGHEVQVADATRETGGRKQRWERNSSRTCTHVSTKYDTWRLNSPVRRQNNM